MVDGMDNSISPPSGKTLFGTDFWCQFYYMAWLLFFSDLLIFSEEGLAQRTPLFMELDGLALS